MAEEYSRTEFNVMFPQEALAEVAEGIESVVMDGKILLSADSVAALAGLYAGLGMNYYAFGDESAASAYEMAACVAKTVFDVITEKHASELVEEGLKGL